MVVPVPEPDTRSLTDKLDFGRLFIKLKACFSDDSEFKRIVLERSVVSEKMISKHRM